MLARYSRLGGSSHHDPWNNTRDRAELSLLRWGYFEIQVGKEDGCIFGLVPQCSDWGGKVRHGYITQVSRKLSRTILAQSLVQVVDASPQFRQFYEKLKEQRGADRAGITFIRKLCSRC